MSNRALLKTKGGYYVWLVTGSALENLPTLKPSVHSAPNTQFLLFNLLSDDTIREHLKLDRSKSQNDI